MAYLALYRAWRPQCFSDVVGQEKTVTALKNAVKDNKLSHAYLFSGPRGTGKTSIAKILAKAVNCESLTSGEPCNKCSSCTDINNGTFMDVVEIDAASNRGIDEIRDLREKVRILPAQGKLKVYIIDEVHMLTTEAFNALLKTIEEPPESVIFILATTELKKIPPTILSRCQSYTFYRFVDDQITSRLREVADKNSIEIQEDALTIIARRANGGMRDALSMLDQIYTYRGNNIEKSDVIDVLGLIDDEFMAKIVEAVINNDHLNIIKMIGVAFKEGKEAQQIARETALYFRDLLFYKLFKDKTTFSIISDKNLPQLKEQEKQIDNEQALEAIKYLMDTAEKIRFSEGQKYILELAFLNLVSIFNKSDNSEVIVTEPKYQRRKTEKEKPKIEVEEKNDAKEIMWGKILKKVKEIKVPTHALLSQGKLIGSRGDTLYIGYKKGYKFHKEKMEEKSNREILDKAMLEVVGKQLDIQFIFLDDSSHNDIVLKKAIEYFGEEIVEVND